jgi:uncharacterized protein YdaT
MPSHNLIRPVDAVVEPFATVQRSTFGEWLRLFSTSTSAFLEFQRAGLQASLSLADAIAQANRQMLEAWAGAAQQTDRALRETEEVSSSEAEPAREQRDNEPRPTIKILKREDEWVVVRESASRPSGVFETKREAVDRARELAKRDQAEVHIGRAADTRRTNGHDRTAREQKPARRARGARRSGNRG